MLCPIGVYRLLTAEEVASILRMSKNSVQDLSIPRVRLGRITVRWQLTDVLAFIDDRRAG